MGEKAETALRWAGTITWGKGNDVITGGYEDLGCGDERVAGPVGPSSFPP